MSPEGSPILADNVYIIEKLAFDSFEDNNLAIRVLRTSPNDGHLPVVNNTVLLGLELVIRSLIVMGWGVYSLVCMVYNVTILTLVVLLH
jgi:hypothetical protein